MRIVHLFVYFARVNFCLFFSSSWCLGLAAASDCGSPWTVLLTFLYAWIKISIIIKTFVLEIDYFSKVINYSRFVLCLFFHFSFHNVFVYGA